MLPISAEPSLSTPSAIFSSDLPLNKLLSPDFWRSSQYRKYRENVYLKK